MQNWRKRLIEGIDGIDKWVKRVGTVVAVIAGLSIVFPPLSRMLTLVSAWRFGAHGVVKYELGDNIDPKSKKPGLRGLTDNGQLFLLRPGGREFMDIEAGDILQAASPVQFHDPEKCKVSKTCADQPIVFTLRTGDCLVVLSRVRRDDAQDYGTYKNLTGGWLEVATAACGLFR